MSNIDRGKPPTESSKGSVLVVDDNAAIRELLSDVLASDGYDVMTAEDGLDALTQLTEPLPDVIISDLRMPRMSGFEFLAAVRRKYPDVPLIALSGEFEGNEVPLGVPADAYFRKGSYTFYQLLTKIRDLASRNARAGAPASHPP